MQAITWEIVDIQLPKPHATLMCVTVGCQGVQGVSADGRDIPVCYRFEVWLPATLCDLREIEREAYTCVRGALPDCLAALVSPQT